MIAQHGFVSGHVQGVAYRAATRREALRLDLRGYARNLADGRVEVLVVGEESAVVALINWLHRGPPLARVTAVEMRAVPMVQFSGFTVE